MRRGTTGLVTAALAVSITFAASARAAPGDAEAQRLLKAAVGSDYLMAKFDDAENKLQQALATCVSRTCSAATRVKLHGYLACVYASQKRDVETITEELVEMLKLDPTARVDEAYVTAPVKRAFSAAAKRAEEERQQAAKRAEEERQAALDEAQRKKEAEREARMRVPPPVGEMAEKPWPEQAVGTPIPVFVKLPAPPSKIEPERAEVVKVVTMYMSPGSPAANEVQLRKNEKGGGWSGEIPCDGVGSEGELTYFTTAYNAYDNPVATSGTAGNPRKVALKVAIAGELPHNPGDLPPRACEAKGPPDSGDKVPCTDDEECTSGARCEKGFCTLPPASATNAKVTRRGCAGCATSDGGSPSGLGALAGLALVAWRRRRARAGALVE